MNHIVDVLMFTVLNNISGYAFQVSIGALNNLRGGGLFKQ